MACVEKIRRLNVRSLISTSAKLIQHSSVYILKRLSESQEL